MFNDLYNSVKVRFGQGSSTQAMGDWICANTTIKKRPFSFEGYEFQRAIADDMHPDVSVIKCSQVGLALALDTPLPTPYGWTTMGAAQVGDQLYDEQGNPCTVTYKSPVWVNRDCYELTFDDGEKVIADGSHRWPVNSNYSFNDEGIPLKRLQRGDRVAAQGFTRNGKLSTEAMARNFFVSGQPAFSIDVAGRLSGSEAPLPIDPWLLGAFLGDGGIHSGYLTCGSEDIFEIKQQLVKRGIVFTIRPHGTPGSFNIVCEANDGSSLMKALKVLGVSTSSGKHIPKQYLRSSEANRWSLLQGLMDTDGTISSTGQASFYNTNPKLIEDVRELLTTLGMKPKCYTRSLRTKAAVMVNGSRIHSRKPIICLDFIAYSDHPVCSLSRKVERHRDRGVTRTDKMHSRRRIMNIEKIPSIPTQCITVDTEKHLFLAGRGMIPTCNTEVQIRKYLGMLTRGNSLSGIFTLPNEKMFTRIYNGRIKPIVDQDDIFNPPVESNPVRRRDQIQIRDSFGYITGCTEGDATSTSADFLMHDEVDLSPQEILALYQSRLQNSDMQMTQKFSTPTYMGFGIDKSYGMTDRHEYLARCEACNHWQIPLFTPEFIKLKDYPFEVEDFTKLSSSQIAQLDLEDAHVSCEQCNRRLNLADPSLREWVPMYPSRSNFRGYWVRPFSTSRLKPRYIFGQLAKYQEDGFIRGFHNTVLGQPYSDKDAQMQRGDIEACMVGGSIPDVGADVPVYLGVDIGFQCHITLSIDNADGIPVFVLFEVVPIGGLESRISDLRKVYNIVQGASDRFPYTSEVDALRDITGRCVMPVQYRGNAALAPVKDELGFITHYSANRTYMLDRIHTFVNHRKLVLSGYGNQKETLVTHLSDMHRDERPDTEAVWVKNSGNDHYFHSMALSLVSRRICDYMYHHQDTPAPVTPDFMGADFNTGGTNLIGGSSKKLSRLGMSG